MSFSVPRQSWVVIFATALVFVTAVFVRIRDLNYNSPFNDEAIYIVVGETGLFEGDWVSYNAASWMAGSPYFYPPVTAIAYKLGGLPLSRFINAVFGILTLWVIYLSVLNLKRNDGSALMSGFLTIALISLIPSGVYISRLATYDAPSFMFLFLSFYLITKINNVDDFNNIGRYYFLAAISLFVAFAFKIVAAIFVPYILVYSAILVYERSGKNIFKDLASRIRLIFRSLLTLAKKSLTMHVPKEGYISDVFVNTAKKDDATRCLFYWRFYFLFPFFLLTFIYLAINGRHILAYYTTQEPLRNITRLNVLVNYWQEIDTVLPFWILGSFGMIFVRDIKRYFILSLGALFALGFHLVFRNAPSLDKHAFLSLPFLGIVAGLGITHFYNILKIHRLHFVLSSILIVLISIASYSSFQKLPRFNSLWRNTYDVQEFVSSVVKDGDMVLAESGASIILAASEKNVPTNVVTYDWFEYRNLDGKDAYVKAIEEGYFNLIQLEDLNQPKLERNSELSSILGVFIYLLKQDYRMIYSKDGFLIYQRLY